MTKTASKQPNKPRNAPPKPSGRKTSESAGRRRASSRTKTSSTTSQATRATTDKQRADTKQARMIALLCGPAGATIDAMMRATGWQQHSVRGFLAGVIRKKLGFDLTSEASERGRVYRINDPTASCADKAA
jgi:hypothetical protein